MTLRFVVFPILLALIVSVSPSVAADPPASWDWRDVDGFNYVPPVRNVGSCGSIYIFGPVAVIETRYRIEVARRGGMPPPIDLSEQHIMDCGSGYYGYFSCSGGYSKDVFTHVRDHGVPWETCYNYVGVEQDCPVDCPDSGEAMELMWPVGEIGELTSFPDEATIMQEVYDHGPVAVSMDTYSDIYTYGSGVYWHVSGDKLGAIVVMIVGWGDEGGQPYWICRNFWGEGWGLSGDFLVSRELDHANCDFGEWVWWCTIDPASVPNESATLGGVKAMFR